MKKSLLFLVLLASIFYFASNLAEVFAISENEIKSLQEKFPKGIVQPVEGDENQFLIEWINEKYPGNGRAYCIDNYYYRGSGSLGETISDYYKLCRPNSSCIEYINASNVKEANCKSEPSQKSSESSSEIGINENETTQPPKGKWEGWLPTIVLSTLLAGGYIIYRRVLRRKIISSK